MKIFDCITFYQENFITNLRFEILKDVVDFFIICESKYDHRGKEKDFNFILNNSFFKNKVIHLRMDIPFQKKEDYWLNQANQREYIFHGLKNAEEEDYIMFSDPDEIPNPNILKNINLQKKYGIFMQKCFCYKLNIFNKYESPWEGTRITKMKNLKSINYLRQKILSKNLSAPFWKLNKDKSIELIQNGGWHFNSLLSPEEISMKLKTFAHKEFSSQEYSDVETIRKKIIQKRDLFKRGWKYKKVQLDETFPTYIYKNRKKLKDWII